MSDAKTPIQPSIETDYVTLDIVYKLRFFREVIFSDTEIKELYYQTQDPSLPIDQCLEIMIKMVRKINKIQDPEIVISE